MRRETEMDLGRYAWLSEQSSMLRWWPVVEALDIPRPRTLLFEEPGHDWLRAVMVAVVDHQRPPDGWEAWWRDVEIGAATIGYPCFLRTDHISGKHEWAATCFVAEPAALLRNFGRLMEETEMASFPVGPTPRAVAVREYLELESSFTAFRGLPIARERRYFVRDGRVECHHPYWPEAAIAEGYPPPSDADWRALLADLNAEGEEVAQLTAWAEQIGAALGKSAQSAPIESYWSVDFARRRSARAPTCRDGRWVMIDAARGEVSWHPECPFATAEGES